MELSLKQYAWATFAAAEVARGNGKAAAATADRLLDELGRRTTKWIAEEDAARKTREDLRRSIIPPAPEREDGSRLP